MNPKYMILLCLALPIHALAERQVLSPAVAERFGEIVEIEAVFVAKPNTYHAQNMVDEPYFLRVERISGKAVDPPVTIEYRYDAPPGATPVFVAGKSYRLKAFETLSPLGAPRGWGNEAAQLDFQIMRRLVIKLSEPKSRH